ncbi:hypothetical protein HPB47_002651, partial [Ixodes persulcatus]
YPADRRQAMLLNCLGEAGRQIYDSLPTPEPAVDQALAPLAAAGGEQAVGATPDVYKETINLLKAEFTKPTNLQRHQKGASMPGDYLARDSSKAAKGILREGHSDRLHIRAGASSRPFAWPGAISRDTYAARGLEPCVTCGGSGQNPYSCRQQRHQQASNHRRDFKVQFNLPREAPTFREDAQRQQQQLRPQTPPPFPVCQEPVLNEDVASPDGLSGSDQAMQGNATRRSKRNRRPPERFGDWSL